MGQYANTAKFRNITPAFALVHVRYIVVPALVWAVAVAAVVAATLWSAAPAAKRDAAQQSSQSPEADPTSGVVYVGA